MSLNAAKFATNFLQVIHILFYTYWRYCPNYRGAFSSLFRTAAATADFQISVIDLQEKTKPSLKISFFDCSMTMIFFLNLTKSTAPIALPGIIACGPTHLTIPLLASFSVGTCILDPAFNSFELVLVSLLPNILPENEEKN